MDVQLPEDSRYKDTPIYSDDGDPIFALWEPPAEFDNAEALPVVQVTAAMEGALDVVAITAYGFVESMWWAIGRVNGVIDPENEVRPGVSLFVPEAETVQSFISRRGLGE